MELAEIIANRFATQCILGETRREDFRGWIHRQKDLVHIPLKDLKTFIVEVESILDSRTMIVIK